MQSLDFMHAPLSVTTASGYQTAPDSYGPALLEAHVTPDGQEDGPVMGRSCLNSASRGALGEGRGLPRITFLPEMVSPQAPAPTLPVQP